MDGCGSLARMQARIRLPAQGRALPVSGYETTADYGMGLVPIFYWCDGKTRKAGIEQTQAVLVGSSSRRMDAASVCGTKN
jgi:hypothetical protein